MSGSPARGAAFCLGKLRQQGARCRRAPAMAREGCAPARGAVGMTRAEREHVAAKAFGVTPLRFIACASVQWRSAVSRTGRQGQSPTVGTGATRPSAPRAAKRFCRAGLPARGVARDPVCGMEVGEGGEALTGPDGREWRFCCAACRWAF